jgi:M6 family metalloprotease-like protein
MKPVPSAFLAAGLLLLLVSGVAAMPTNPLAVEKAGGANVLSNEVLAPPPDYVDQPLSIPARGHAGNYKALLIVIKFTDQTNVFSKESFDNMAFLGWPTGTINQYYTEVSYGNLTLSGQVFGWYASGQARAYYGGGLKGWGTYPQNTGKLVEEAVDAAQAAGCDFSQFDNDGDGVAESIFIVHSGQGCETSLDTNDIQSHVSSITNMGGTARSYDGVTVNTYACCPELQSSTPATHINIGVYCHEYGHILGLPDQYDVRKYCTAYNNWGTGAWALMSFGGWGGDVITPSSPTHICPWGKNKLGWLTPTVLSGVTSQPVTLSPIETNPQVLKLGMNSSETEYFLVAFYDSTLGFDRSLVKKGLLIFHVDDNVWTANDCEDGGSCTSSGFHSLVALEQPDGSFHLDCAALGNYADVGDMYPYQTIDYFDDMTTPHSNAYRGTSSGVSISNIAWANPPKTLLSVDVTSGVLYDEVAYDDGARDACYMWGTSDAGFAVRVTPTQHPAMVHGLNIMGCNSNGPNFQCRLWDASGTGGKPGSPLSPVHTTTGAAAYAWVYEDFSADSVIIAAGDFWAVYIEYNQSMMGSDTSSPWSGRTMTYYMGNFYVDNGGYGNYMIRAVLDTVSVPSAVPVPPQEAVTSVGPNPFSSVVALNFFLAGASDVSVTIYDIGGRVVRDVGARTYAAGRQSLVWDGADAAGKPVGAGIYFYKLTAGGMEHTGKMSLVR